MKMLPEEELALRMIFNHSDGMSIEMLRRIEHAVVLERDRTKYGFFSVIRLEFPLNTIPEIRMHEFNFEHPALLYGGSFMCSFRDIDVVELEAVTLGGEAWPNFLNPDEFSEIGI
ncbi:MAG: hypothetical protein PHP85_05930 [Gallionella sp.]|nr:hypothetical protein [Gallionella sp.]